MIIQKYILIFFLLALSPLLHPLHLTVSNIEVVKGDNVKVSVKIFIDDFETVLYRNFRENVRITEDEDGEINLCDSLMNDYVRKNFRISFSSDGFEQLIYIGRDQNDEAVFLEYEIAGFPETGKIIAENSILNDLYEDQKNLVFVVYGEKKVGYTLNSDNIRFVFELSD